MEKMFIMPDDDPAFAHRAPLTTGSMAKALADARDALARGKRQDAVIAETIHLGEVIKTEIQSLSKRLTAIEEVIEKHPDKELPGALAILGAPLPEMESPLDDPRFVKAFAIFNEVAEGLNKRHAAILAKLDEPMPPKTAGPRADITKAPHGGRVADEGGHVEPGQLLKVATQ